MIATDGPRRDTWTLKTALRPDFYAYFPRFSPEELDARLDRLPFCRATLLTEWNIRRARAAHPAAERGFAQFVGSAAREQRHRLADVLSSVGISARTAAAVAAVPRHRYVPARSQHMAYLNVHVPTGTGSCLTPPGLVAVMLDLLGCDSGETVVEFGAGSGYHLACAAHIVGSRGRAVGVDLRFPRGSSRTPVSAGLVRGDVAAAPLRPGCADAVYATCFTRRPADTLAHLIRAGGRVQFAGPITASEFGAEPHRSWLRSTFTDHRSYLATEPQRFACLRTWVKPVSEELALRHSLYDVSFVPEARPNSPSPDIRKPRLT
ncbi:hypothetical protein FZ103_07050 [Streptomonospora sp. PA3]|uniref:hypothetical protein n=1 Tax=Streptomonospora sp. PA3 TaxID=2607326 RepID=UPI0012DEE0F3|nr:hypothetical protein [Streptomonospora sp. PA3]MUL40945.1 hypothetical protein [Streptomonospora sp. PA3]